MNPLPLVLQAYTPQIHLGDWQIVISVNRKRNIVSVERWHSSEQPYERKEMHDQVIRLETGIRAFRRQMPVLAGALEKVAVDGLSEPEIVESVFKVLANMYAAAPDALSKGEDAVAKGNFADFIEERKRDALAQLNGAKH